MKRTDHVDDDAAPPASGRAPGAVAAVFDAAGRVLVTRRPDNGMWVLPGGRLELGETITQTAVREVLEETGVEIAVTGGLRPDGRPRDRLIHPSGQESRSGGRTGAPTVTAPRANEGVRP